MFGIFAFNPVLLVNGFPVIKGSAYLSAVFAAGKQDDEEQKQIPGAHYPKVIIK
jgi:hypothetical protein